MGRDDVILQLHHGDHTHHSSPLQQFRARIERSHDGLIRLDHCFAKSSYLLTMLSYPSGMQGLFSAVYDLRFESPEAQADISY